MDMLQQVFEGQEIRATERDGEFWFVASDVAKLLGYRDAANLIRRLDDDEKGTHSASTPGGSQELSVINESGLYAAILGSKREGAKPFRRWVTHDLLPTLRRTGFYSIRQPVVTARAIAAAYGVKTSNVAYYMEGHQIPVVGVAEHPDTGKDVDLYPRALVMEQFMLGSGPKPGVEFRAYSGGWNPVERPLQVLNGARL